MMRTRNHGKYTKMSNKRPQAIGRCDYTGLMAAHRDMSFQYQYTGDGLVNTGYLVYSKFKDEPNPQSLAPPLPLAPKPIPNPRPGGFESSDLKIVGLTLSDENIFLDEEQSLSYGVAISGDVKDQEIYLVLRPVMHEIWVENNADESNDIRLAISSESPESFVPQAFPLVQKISPGKSFWAIMGYGIQRIYNI